MAELSENVNTIRQEIKNACLKYNRKYEDITIVAASKTVPPETLNKLGALGITACGENRVQEFLQKYGSVNTSWHFIGRLQTNKVKYIADKIELLHSLDRVELAEEIERQCVKKNVNCLKALIEVNAAGEENKGGVPIADTFGFYEEMKKYPHIKICGLMTVMPVFYGSAEEKFYLQMRQIYDKIKENADCGFKYLSMGMTGDYITALKYGANMLRLGRALFGERKTV